MRRPEVSLEEREQNLDLAELELSAAAVMWVEARAVGRRSPRLDAKVDEAQQACKAAARRLEETRKRLNRQT